jgi:hypothetical protein
MNKVLPRIVITTEKIEASRIRKVRLTPDKIYKPTTIDFPPNEYRTGRSIIQFKGRAHEGTTLTISTQDNTPVDVKVDSTGSFVSSSIQLKNKVNNFAILNRTIKNLDAQNAQLALTVYLEASLSPIFKRIDPITRTRLETVDIYEIIRCRACNNFQLLTTWIGGSSCPICQNGVHYWGAERDEFWVA